MKRKKTHKNVLKLNKKIQLNLVISKKNIEKFIQNKL